jgi:hypothetical protein
VQRRADRRRLGHRGDDVVGEVARVRAGEADAFDPGHRADRPEQLAEGGAVAERAAVRVDVLPQGRDLEDALLREYLDLAEDVARAAVLLLAAQRRDDAEGAGVVAADADRDPGAGGAGAAGRQRAGEDLERLKQLDLRQCSTRARSSSTGSDPTLWAPKTTST